MPPPVSGVTVLFADVSVLDEKGLPMKESLKGKMGLFNRAEDDVEYVGISVPTGREGGAVGAVNPQSATTTFGVASDAKRPLSRLLLKHSRFENDEGGEENVGDTPKLRVAKGTVKRAGATMPGVGSLCDSGMALSVRTDLLDLHCYAIAPWVWGPMLVDGSRSNLSNMQTEVLPILVGLQFQGVGAALALPKGAKVEDALKATLPPSLPPSSDSDWDGNSGATSPIVSRGPTMLKNASVMGSSELMKNGDADSGDKHSSRGSSGGAEGKDAGSSVTASSSSSSSSGGSSSSKEQKDAEKRESFFAKREFFVAAHVLPRTDAIAARATTISNYLFLCRGVLAHAVSAGKDKSGTPFVLVANIGQISAKDNVQTQEGCHRGAGGDLRNSTVGKNVRIGAKCKLNNCVVMENAVIGDNCVIQNTVVCWGANVSEKCNLDNCIVAGGAVVSAGTKSKNETIE